MHKKWFRFAIAVAGLLGLIAMIYFWAIRKGEDQLPGSQSAAMAPAGHDPYVAEQACGQCHAEQVAKQRTSGHADTLRRTSESPIATQLAGQSFRDPEGGYTYQYHLDPEAGLSVTIPERLGNDRFPLTYEFGSGQNAVTFLTLLPDRWSDTVGIEHRISLYRGEQGWELDLTPGHRQALATQDVEQFGRVLRGDTLTRCVDCHTTTAEIAWRSKSNRCANVGCQSCHGPGQETHGFPREASGKGCVRRLHQPDSRAGDRIVWPLSSFARRSRERPCVSRHHPECPLSTGRIDSVSVLCGQWRSAMLDLP